MSNSGARAVELVKSLVKLRDEYAVKAQESDLLKDWSTDLSNTASSSAVTNSIGIVIDVFYDDLTLDELNQISDAIRGAKP